MLGREVAALPPHLRQLERLMRTHRFPVVHLNDSPLLAAAMVSHRNGAKVVWHLRSALAGEGRDRRSRAIAALMERWGDAAIAIDRDVAERFPIRLPLTIVHNSVEPPVSRNGAGKRPRSGSPAEDRVAIGFAGFVRRQKGWPELVEAADILVREGAPAHFVIMGGGVRPPEYFRTLRGRALEATNLLTDEESAIKELVAREGSRARTSRSSRSPPTPARSTARSTSSRSRTRASGSVARCSRPRRTASRSSPRARATARGSSCPGGTGFLLDDARPERIAAALRELIADPELRARLGAAALEHARERFDPLRNARAVEAVYDELLGLEPDPRTSRRARRRLAERFVRLADERDCDEVSTELNPIAETLARRRHLERRSGSGSASLVPRTSTRRASRLSSSGGFSASRSTSVPVETPGDAGPLVLGELPRRDARRPRSRPLARRAARRAAHANPSGAALAPGKSFAVCSRTTWTSWPGERRRDRSSGTRRSAWAAAARPTTRCVLRARRSAQLERCAVASPFAVDQRHDRAQLRARAQVRGVGVVLLHRPTGRRWKSVRLRLCASDHCTFRGARTTVADLIRALADDGFDVGLHGSYHSATDPGILATERATFEHATGITPTTTRQHFLHWDITRTPQLQNAAGFTADSTLGFNRTVGFRASTALPFRQFDVVADEELALLEVPLVIEDSALLGPIAVRGGLDHARDRVQELVDTTREVGGAMTFLFHPDKLLQPEWLELYEWSLRYLAESGAWLTSLSELERWWTARERRLLDG